MLPITADGDESCRTRYDPARSRPSLSLRLLKCFEAGHLWAALSQVPPGYDFSYCGVDCEHMPEADVSMQVGESEAVLLKTLEAMLSAHGYCLLRSVAA